MKKEVETLLRTLKTMKEFKKVKFIFIYGSEVSGEKLETSDVDFCVYYDTNDKEEMVKFRLRLLSKLPKNFDVQIFQLLPLFMRKEVLKGKLIYAKDEKFVYQKAYETLEDFESFKRHYYDYIGMMK